MEQAAFIELLKTLGQAAIFAYAAYKFYQDGRASDKIWTGYLLDQNRMLMAFIMQQNFLRSPAVAPAVTAMPEEFKKWMQQLPTDLQEVKVGQI